MVWDLILGFVLLVAGTYIGATMALRGFFGREYYDPRTGDPKVARRNLTTRRIVSSRCRSINTKNRVVNTPDEFRR